MGIARRAWLVPHIDTLMLARMIRLTIASLLMAVWTIAPLPAKAQHLPPSPHQATVIVTFDTETIATPVAQGLANTTEARPVTADDPVRVASVSKLVVAMAVMRLVDAQKLDLDRDISDYLGYRVRNPAFPEKPISLRLLLSHQSSLMDGDDLYIIPLGARLQDRLNDPRLWDSAHKPGRYFRYANINYPVIASILEHVTGKRFDAAMQDLVFTPLAIDACFNWTTCSDAAINRAVTLYGETGLIRRDDLKGTRPPCAVVTPDNDPCDLASYSLGENGALFSPQGGLRISMRNLARIGQILLTKKNGFLSRRSLTLLRTPIWQYRRPNGDTQNGFFCAFGLGVQTIGLANQDCASDGFGDGKRRFGHAGEAYGLRAGLWMDAKAKTGIAFFVTAVPDSEPQGVSGFYRIEELILQNSYPPPGR